MATKQTTVPRSVSRLFPNVTHVVDAKRPIRVSVSAMDCAKGKKLEASECALACATRRQYKADGAVIGLSVSYIIKGTKAIKFQTSEAVAREIVSFDRHSDFAPGSYNLEAIRPSQRREVRAAKSGRNRRGSGKRIIHKRTVRVRNLKD